MTPPPTLDEIATLLLQLEPGDHDDLARAREQLAELAFGNRVSIAAQPLVARALRVLKPLADGTAPDPDAAFGSLCDLLEQAMAADVPAVPSTAPSRPAVTTPPDHVRPTASALPDSGRTVRSLAAPPPASDRLPDDVDAALLRDFLAESRDALAAAESALLALETRPSDGEALNTVFRAFHTVKGTSAFLGLDHVGAFAHEAESLLDRVRGGAVAYTAPCADLALRATDMLRGLLGAVEHALASGGSLALPDGHAELVAALAAYDGRATAPDATPASRAGAASAERRQAERRQGERRQASESFVRVRTDRLDQLVDLVGELVIAHAMLAADAAVGDGEPPNTAAAAAPDPAARDALARKVAHAGKIVRELQELAIGLRTVPLRPTVQKLSRLVRDVAARLGKEVDFVTEGEDTEIDRAVADGLGDPLVHMLRNALDHGLEPPDARAAAGKPRRGRVRLAARHAGGAVVVELSDDGRGLDRERIARKAVERGLIESDRGMSDAEVHALIFAPGFSTAEVVTDLSGRGVGMDVVRRELERVRGRVDIASAAGQGTTFTVRLPLTLAVADGMLVRVGDERYVVPTANVHMSFRPAPGALHTVAGRGEVVTLRGDVLPVVRLHALFGVGGAERDPARAILMLVGDGARRAALLVDELLGQQQVVVKALGDGIGRVPGLAGGAILGDGRVGLILDVPEVVALAERGEALAAA